ncbi:uncharacterized protein GIQ15_03370 [Arthroderma uncinatum]|uniref:uncharacterized protein n=1 Tax=Arthroderma uncinatum TaxID=74035 RepID=UPI00144A8A38|nr:uncharacterized protein GIQ15_03370 [Arthroderma uncinatum]KAF3484046.1 hypothetical protein GIQ15_03370 [Arthroderma uncinatum]
MNQEEEEAGPSGRGNLKGFYSYKNTFGADSVWLEIPKRVVFVDNSDPYADDLVAQFGADTPLGTHEECTWGHDGGYQASSMDAQTHGLDALSAAATAENYPLQQHQPSIDDVAEHNNRFDHIEHHQPPGSSHSTPNRAQSPAAASPRSPSLSISSPNNNINFLLNPSSNAILTPVDPNLHSPADRRVFPDQYFGSQVPVEALTNSLLRYAACAYAAKQLGRVNGNKAVVGGVCQKQARMELWPDANRVDWYYYGAKYYERAIQLLMEELQHDGQSPSLSTLEANVQSQAGELDNALEHTSKGRKQSSASGQLAGAQSDEVLAATAILSVYEFLDATGPAWDRHLSGVKSLLDIANVGMISLDIQDPSGNLAALAPKRAGLSKARKAIFWNFARQDYLSAFINEGQTRLNTSDLALWTEAGILLDDAGYVQPSGNIEPRHRDGKDTMRVDMVSNALIWILSKIVDSLAAGDDMNSGESQHPLLDRWHQLQAELDAWYKGLPNTFNPSARMESSQTASIQGTPASEDDHPFPEVWYSIPMCASTMQHYHMARILLLTNKPHELTASRSMVTNEPNSHRPIESEIQHHSYEICGISMARPRATVRVHSVQPLFICGRCLTASHERKVILQLLCGIEADLGWATKYRVQQLLREWEWDEAAIDDLSGP